MGRKFLCGVVASLVLSIGCANSQRNEEERLSIEPIPQTAVFSEIDFSEGFNLKDGCFHVPLNIPLILPPLSIPPKADFLIYTPSLNKLDDILFKDYLTRSFASERLYLDVDIGAILIEQVFGVRPAVKEFGFFLSDAYATVCPSGSSGCQYRQRIAILRTHLEEQIDIIGTVLHEEGHTLASPAANYNTPEEKALEEGKAYLTRLGGCLEIQFYDEEVMEKCVDGTLSFIRSFLRENGSVSLRDLDKMLNEKEEEALLKNSSIYPFHKIGYTFIFVLAAKNKGNLRESYQILAAADSKSLYDSLMNSSLTVSDVFHLGAEAIDRHYGSQIYSNLFGEGMQRRYVLGGYCDEVHLTPFNGDSVFVDADNLFKDLYPMFIRNEF